jgi:protein involved in polysaccharide export with SLBB domain
MTIVEAISRAGGFTAMARQNAVTVTRTIEAQKQTFTVPVASISKGKANPFYMRPGDVVFVPQRPW